MISTYMIFTHLISIDIYMHNINFHPNQGNRITLDRPQT
jgi:hypothetical protein